MSIRTDRVSRMIQREVADLLQNDFSDASAALLTVTGVRVTKDLGIAYVNLSALGDQPEARKLAVRQVQELTPQIRHALAQRVRHDMKRVPELRFFLDETAQQASRMEELFAQINADRDEPAEEPEDGDETSSSRGDY